MKLSIAAACLALGGLLSACGGGSGATADVAPATPAVARLQWTTPAPLFTASGQQHTLQVQALDASGHVLDVPISWQSNEPNVVAVGGGSSAETATLTAQASTGAAVLTASAGGHSITAVAVVAVPAVGTVVLTDAQVDGQPQATEATLAAGGLRVGSTYTVRLQAGVAAPAVGSLVLGQGTKAVAGEVVAVDGQLITLAMVPLERLLPQLQLDVDLPLTALAPGSSTGSASAKASRASTKAHAQAETSFSVAGFECDAEGSAGGVELAKKDVAPLGLDSLRYRVLWNSSRKMLRLSGQPGVQFELEPTAKIAFTGKVDCQLELADIPIPLPPTIGLFLGVGFPVGVGFTLEGALPVNGVALNLKGQAQADVVVGFDCNPGCASLNSVTPSGTVTPAITAPDFTANRLDLSGQVYAWANFEGGARWSSTLQFDAIEAQAGLKFATTVATENAQAKDAASAGQYALTFEASAAPTEALGDMADLVGLILDAAKLETSVPLGRSPSGTLAADKTRFKTGDDVRLQVDLTAEEVLFPLQGYNVQVVRVYRKTVAEDGSYVLVLAGEQAASSGQTQFTIPWLATVDSGSNISFVAFVQTKLLNGLRWQVGLVQADPQTASRFSLVARPGGGYFDKTECVMDTQTGLMWEGKTLGGERGGDQRYTNYDDSGNGGVQSTDPFPPRIDGYQNAASYVRRVNDAALCGFSGWRLPTLDELLTLFDNSVSVPGSGIPFIVDLAWFPNQTSGSYGTSTPYQAGYLNTQYMAVYFNGAGAGYQYRYSFVPLRLVR